MIDNEQTLRISVEPAAAGRANSERLTFDRRTGAIRGATWSETVLIRMFQLGSRISSMWSFRGYGFTCRQIRKLIRKRNMLVRLNDDAVFCFPFADSYWSTLLDRGHHYEDDIGDFLKRNADCKYSFIDCGANFGFWSALASSKPFGAQNVIAIEPSSRSYGVLANNAAINGNRFQVLRNAIGSKAGIARLSGNTDKHETLSIAGGADAEGEDVAVISLDDLIERGSVDVTKPTVVKLDVEGMEIEALKGGSALLRGDCVIICEEHGNDRHHSVSRYILQHTAMKLFCHDPATGRLEHLTDLSPLDRIKRFSNRGYNVLATASPFWQQRIEAR